MIYNLFTSKSKAKLKIKIFQIQFKTLSSINNQFILHIIKHLFTAQYFYSTFPKQKQNNNNNNTAHVPRPDVRAGQARARSVSRAHHPRLIGTMMTEALG